MLDAEEAPLLGIGVTLDGGSGSGHTPQGVAGLFLRRGGFDVAVAPTPK
jgi:hypothetical protein